MARRQSAPRNWEFAVRHPDGTGVRRLVLAGSVDEAFEKATAFIETNWSGAEGPLYVSPLHGGEGDTPVDQV